MGYEMLGSHSRKSAELPVITFGSGGIIYINSFAMNKHLKNVKRVIILYDKDMQKLAIKPVAKDIDGSYKLNFSSQERKSTGMISARSALKTVAIKNKRFEGIWNNSEKMIEVSLK
jgi:5S rRNA maturation endonuclease (ribonuclease M5)